MSYSKLKWLSKSGSHSMVAKALLLSLCSLGASPVYAESKALLIGVGEFIDPKVPDLPGIDLDIDIMRRVAFGLGYSESATRVLLDEKANINNIKQSLQSWLTEGVGEDDNILIYFSTHGSQVTDTNGDESDGLDEILLASDYSASGDNPSGGLLDDDFNEILSALPTENVVIIVDACHSGTGFKSVSMDAIDGLMPKYYHTEGVKSTVDDNDAAGVQKFAVVKRGSDAKFVAFMAAADSEMSLASSQGSLFTLGVRDALSHSIGGQQSVTPKEFIAHVKNYVKEKLSDKSAHLMFTPQLGGYEPFFDKPLQLLVSAPEPMATTGSSESTPPTPTAANGSNRNELTALADMLKPLEMNTNKTTYPLGDKSLKVTVKVPAEGYLNIVTVDPDDQAIVLFPNKFNLNNHVGEGEVTLPTQEMAFDLEAQGPLGQHAIYAFWTESNINWYTESGGKLNDKGELDVVFSELSETSKTRFMPVASQQESVLGSMLTVDMVQ